MLGLHRREWSWSRSVTTSPVVEHLALAAADALVAICSLCLLVLLRPTWYQEASDDVRSDVVELPKPSMIYVAILSIVCGLVGALAKGLVVAWCFSQRAINASGSRPPIPALCGFLVQDDSLGGYYICPRVIVTLFSSWVCVTAVIFQLLGAPLECVPSSLLLGIVFASIGFLGPYASAVAEACRSTRWELARGQSRPNQSEQPAAAAEPAVALPVDTAPVAGPNGLRGAIAAVGALLRALDYLCFPLVFASQKLQARASRRGSSTTSLHPQELGNLLVFLAVLPLVICCILCLVSCILLPMDWPTVYIVYPSPLVIFISLGYPLACVVCFLILLLLPVHYNFPNRYARALPVLQALMLKPGGAFPSKNGVDEDVPGDEGKAASSSTMGVM